MFDEIQSYLANVDVANSLVFAMAILMIAKPVLSATFGRLFTRAQAIASLNGPGLRDLLLPQLDGNRRPISKLDLLPGNVIRAGDVLFSRGRLGGLRVTDSRGVSLLNGVTNVERKELNKLLIAAIRTARTDYPARCIRQSVNTICA